MFDLLGPHLARIADGRTLNALKRQSREHPRAVSDRLEGVYGELAAGLHSAGAESSRGTRSKRREKGTRHNRENIAQIETLLSCVTTET